jgi:hypothetical protein
MRHAVEVAARHDLRHAVDVSADHMPAEFIADSQRPFEIDLVARPPRPKGRHGQGFRADVHRNLSAVSELRDVDHRQADARMSDRGAQGNRARFVMAGDAETPQFAAMLDINNFADIAYQASEHRGALCKFRRR